MRRNTRLEKRGAASVEIGMPYGWTAEMILERACANGFSLILMGSQRRIFMQAAHPPFSPVTGKGRQP
jgi:hypothetical protein